MDKKRLLELAGVPLNEAEERIPGRQLSDVKWKNRPSSADTVQMPKGVMDTVQEALELAVDTIQRRDEVTPETIEFTINALHKTLKEIDPHHSYKK